MSEYQFLALLRRVRDGGRYWVSDDRIREWFL